MVIYNLIFPTLFLAWKNGLNNGTSCYWKISDEYLKYYDSNFS